MSSPRATTSRVVPSDVKRRKVRKGTHSCWECKRRKMKCTFDPCIVSASCNGCRRRGSHCISQEFVEDNSDVASIAENAPISRSGAAEISITTPSEDSRRPDHTVPTPLSMISELPQHVAFGSPEHYPSNLTTPETTAADSQNERLSRILHGSLPSRKDVKSICETSRHSSILAHELLTMPYTTLFQNGLKTPDTLSVLPTPDQHPVLIARYMLRLATFLQHLHPNLHREIQSLSEPPRAIMERLAHVALTHVTTNDGLLGSVEYLECVMTESLYQANIGNLRRSWVSGRRALSIAQLMGFHRLCNISQYKLLDPKTEYNPQLMWLRIVTLDRHLCLLLGIPQGCIDRNMASETQLTNDTPMGRLERMHCVLMSRILQRNECEPTSEDLATTRSIDMELQKAARGLTSKWWLVPKLNNACTDLQVLFWDTRRLLAQIFHYNLLVRLHLPYMMRPSSTGHNYEYSRLTCVNASREVLSRYITLRNFNRIAYSCRTVDFLALMAALALLLAHLSGQRAGPENLLAHQNLGDLAMIEQVQENMAEINKLNSDALSAQSADLLKKLLAIEDESGDGRISVKETGSNEPVQQDEAVFGQEGVVSVHIPYFGIIRIGGEATSRMQVATTENMQSTASLQMDRPYTSLDTSTDSRPLHLDPALETSSLAHSDSAVNVNSHPPSTEHNSCLSIDSSGTHQNAGFCQTTPAVTVCEPSTAFASQQQKPQQLGRDMSPSACLSLIRVPPLHSEDPELAANADEWAFQGVDMAFFESIMRTDEIINAR